MVKVRAVRSLVGLAGILFGMNTALSATQASAQAAEMLPGVQRALRVLRADADWIMEQQVRVTLIPAPPFHEEKRALYLEEGFRKLGLSDVHRDEVGNVLGTRPGADPNRVVLVSAHLDTIFPPETVVEVRQQGTRWVGPGIADNAAGLAALLGLIRALEQSGLRTKATLLFVANVGEEGEGNLRGMQALFARPEFRRRVQAAVIIDGSTAERITTRALGSKRFEIVVEGPGGHSWADFGLPNPIQALARVVQRLTDVMLPTNPRSVLNIGQIDGGIAVNSIPARASMKVDVRSEAEREIERLEKTLRTAVAEAVTEENAWARTKRTPLTAEIRVIGHRPAGDLPSSANILRVFRSVDKHLGIRSLMQRSSTDANIPISLGVEAVAVGGGGRSASSHSLQEWYDPAGRGLALKRILLALTMLAGVETANGE